jgi:outer membrane PBP1 activator LpoA protein
MDALKDTWKQFPSAYFRLIAMGIDAYNLATRLGSLELSPYPGATGILSLTTDQRIQRRLTCATFKNGQPEIGDEYQRTMPIADKGTLINHAVQ